MKSDVPGAGTLLLTLPAGHVQEFGLGSSALTLGRAEGNDVVLTDTAVSRIHARLERRDDEWVIEDLKSTNGVWVNGAKTGRAVLSASDVITIGPYTLRIQADLQQPDPDVTMIQSLSDVEATLAGTSLPMNLTDTTKPRLTVHTPSRTWEIAIEGDAVPIGRTVQEGIALEDQKVSRNHAVVERRGGSFVVRDMGSRNGTWLGGRRIETETLREGDTVRIGDAQIVFKAGLDSADMTVVDLFVPSSDQARRPVVIVPGIMGSELWHGSQRVWPNVRHMFAHPEIYMLPEEKPLEARNLVDEVVVVPNLYKMDQYARLLQYLEEGLGYEQGKDLLPFAYDWRKDVREAAKRLAQAIDNWNASGPVTIIAHSMGSLVSRYYVERLGGRSKVERLLMMGAPHNGGPKAIAALLTGKGLIPFGLMGEQVRRVFSTFTSAHQILPSYPCVFDQDGEPVDLLEDASWLPEGQRRDLEAARQLRSELPPRSSVPCVSIFGYGMKTTTRADIKRDPDGRWQDLTFKTELSGDSTVPESSAILPGSDIHPVQQYHGSLYVDNDVKMRLKLELTSPRG